MTEEQPKQPSSEPAWVKIGDGSDREWRSISMYELRKIEQAINESEPGHLKELHDQGNEVIDHVRSRPYVDVLEGLETLKLEAIRWRDANWGEIRMYPISWHDGYIKAIEDIIEELRKQRAGES